ncbi:biotin-dependent carboxyltransferase family protein [Anaerophilus nitritogenes]|uniref:5-oxoprolinase subunit C family protein n=1 Tax=Anaerophilus nitritogenes TaxID=2498136 RepID=UPI00101C686A|nr:biotin-dependent carboxyltransferase family protein [Anaerophilus nitritogenes]
MGQIKIVHPGLLTTIQDEGRYGYQQFGVPVSGVMDDFSYRVSNILVGNEEKEAVLEVTMMGPTIEFEEEGMISITGGDLSPMINGKSISMWRSIHVKTGDTLSFGAIKSGCRSYISFCGGIKTPIVMGSRSTYMKAKIGGLEGRALKAGDIVPIGEKIKNFSSRILPVKYIPQYEKEIEVRVILGPQEDAFTKEGIHTFLANSYTVTNECDRMGFRLDGEEIKHIDGGDIISDGINFGAIQIPGHGKPIVMMADRQTTGGYTKIANVISVDLYKIAQAKPKDQIRFKKVDIKQAQNLLKETNEKIEQIKEVTISQEIIKINKYIVKINGKSYEVKVEEIKV